jgi:hypothetical protein
MTEIKISDGITTITMPRTRQVQDAGELAYIEKEMASGKRVRDVKGFRPGFTYTWDYVPASTITALVTMLRSGSFFTVDYFDVDGTDKTGLFAIDYPSFEVFTFKGGVAVWHNCTLTIRAQGVS